ncbi:MAG: hypothetical protein D6B27_10275 [Gammaproteobacteria bacterium]|nr:MAG: hypothetical protein D6B27_10275 [Gammaproteobacteria bacterium]
MKLTAAFILSCMAIFSSLAFAKKDNKNNFLSFDELKYETEDENFEIKLNGYLFFDTVNYDDSGKQFEFKNGSDLRSARIAVKTKLFKRWKAKLQYDFSKEEPERKDAWLSYDVLDNLTVRLGQFEQYSSLEGSTSLKNTTYLERSIPVETFLRGRTYGIDLQSSNSFWGVQAGTYIEEHDQFDDPEKRHKANLALRLFTFPVESKKYLVHFGIWGLKEYPANGKFEAEAEPETNINEKNILDSGKIKHVDSVLINGLEAAFIYKSFSLQTEYLSEKIDREEDRASITYDGYYASISYFWTGERRKYDKDDGSFDEIEPKHFWGAFETAIRYSYIDMSDENRDRGEMDSITLALNWYPTDQIRLQYNYSKVDFTDSINKIGISQLRAHYHF